MTQQKLYQIHVLPKWDRSVVHNLYVQLQHFYKLTVDIKRFIKAPLVIPVMLAYLIIIVSEISLNMYSLHTFYQPYKSSYRKSCTAIMIKVTSIISYYQQQSRILIFPFAHTSPEQELHAHPHRSVSHSTLGIHTTPVAQAFHMKAASLPGEMETMFLESRMVSVLQTLLESQLSSLRNFQLPRLALSSFCSPGGP